MNEWKMLSKIISPYVYYTNEFGLYRVRIRQWHPAWFIPVLKTQIIYWLGTYRRYKSQQETLTKISGLLTEDWPSEIILDEIEAAVQMTDCDFECDWHESYGFVPEAGCPIHDDS